MNIHEECAKIADDLWGEGPSNPYDNGGTSDGWNQACNKIAELIRAKASQRSAVSVAYQACLNNLREAWSALAMIRETVETLAPSGSVKASEHLDGPAFMHEAEALVAGIMALTPPVPARPDVREMSSIECAASYLASTLRRTAWEGLRSDGRAKDAGFDPWVGYNARQEDYCDVVREVVRLAHPQPVTPTPPPAPPVREGLELVCSNKPRPSVQKGAKGNQHWRRDVHHIAGYDKKTLCGIDASEWLVIGPCTETATDDSNLCARCCFALASPLGVDRNTKKCPQCQGDGYINTHVNLPDIPCPSCSNGVERTEAMRGTLERARQYIADCGPDDDPEGRAIAEKLLSEIDAALSTQRETGRPEAVTVDEINDFLCRLNGLDPENLGPVTLHEYRAKATSLLAKYELRQRIEPVTPETAKGDRG